MVQWLALFLLFLGISLVQIENITSTTPKQDVNATLGLIYVVTACKYDVEGIDFSDQIDIFQAY